MMDKIIPETLKGTTYLSGKAGSFSGVPQRTVQAWTDQGLLKCRTSGTGDRRQYTPLQCIEIGIIKALTQRRLSLKVVKPVLKALRTDNSLAAYLDYDRAYLIVPLYPYEKPTDFETAQNVRVILKPLYIPFYWNEGHQFKMKTKDDIIRCVFEHKSDEIQVINLTRIAKRVLNNMG